MSGKTNNPAPTTLTERLTAIITHLRRVLGDESHRLRVDQTRLIPAWNRLGRLLRQFCALALNPPKPIRPYAPRSINPDQKPTHQTPPPATFPRERGWLRHLVPSHWVNGAFWDLRNLIETPDMIALVAFNPRLKPILRAYCFMLGIPIQAYLKAEPRPHKPRTKPSTAKPSAPKPAKPRPPKPFKSLTRADLFKPHPLPFELAPPNPLNFSKRN